MSETATEQRVFGLLEEVLASPAAVEEGLDGLELVDVEVSGAMLRVFVDRPGGIDIDTIASASRLASSALDEAGAALGGLAAKRWVLEVSSPGIERRLRTPDHFRRFVGTEVTVKTVPGTEPRRIEGVLVGADDDGIVVGTHTLAYDQVSGARTRFVWPSTDSSGRPAKPTATKKGKAAAR